MKLTTSTEIINQRDQLPLEDLKRQTKEIKQEHGRVDYRLIFEHMGYRHAFGDSYTFNQKSRL